MRQQIKNFEFCKNFSDHHINRNNMRENKKKNQKKGRIIPNPNTMIISPEWTPTHQSFHYTGMSAIWKCGVSLLSLTGPKILLKFLHLIYAFFIFFNNEYTNIRIAKKIKFGKHKNFTKNYSFAWKWVLTFYLLRLNPTAECVPPDPQIPKSTLQINWREANPFVRLWLSLFIFPLLFLVEEFVFHFRGSIFWFIFILNVTNVQGQHFPSMCPWKSTIKQKRCNIYVFWMTLYFVSILYPSRRGEWG